MPKMIWFSPPTSESLHTSSPHLIGARLILHRKRLTMIIPMMTHQHGVTTHAIDPHLGQKPKLGGRYTNITVIYIMFSRFFVYPLFRFLFGFCCFFLKTQKYQKYFRCFSWFVSLLWFALK